jgi:hypothetical protein
MPQDPQKPIPSLPSVLPKTAEELRDMMTAHTAQMLERLGITGPKPLTPNESHEKAKETNNPTGSPVTYVPYISRESIGGTGSAMLLVLGKKSKVVGIHRHTRPVGFDHPTPAGKEPGPNGRLPEGMRLYIQNSDGTPTGKTDGMARKYIYDNFTLPDLKSLTKKPLNEAGRMTPAEIKEWLVINPLLTTPEHGSAVGSLALPDDDDEAAE